LHHLCAILHSYLSAYLHHHIVYAAATCSSNPASTNAEDTIEASNFKPVWDVLNALKAHDDVLACELDQIRTEMGRKSRAGISADSLQKISIDLPATVNHTFSSALRTYLVEQVTAPWNYFFGLLEEFTEREGYAKVPNKFESADGFRLGQWASVQRRTKDSMSSERKTRLEGLLGWSWEFREDNWEEGFCHVKEFTDREGYARVPYNFKSVDGYNVGLWVANQRARIDIISPERKERLEALPGWSWNPFTEKWEKGFCYLKEFVDKQGHAEVPQNYKTADGFSLGSWVTTQRLTQSNITPERKVLLEVLPGWTWNTVDKKWGDGFSKLIEFSATYGHANPPISCVTEDGYRLGQWVSVQRGNKDIMSLERREQLESIPDWCWDPLAAKWEKGFYQLKKFVEREGHCLPRALYKTEDGYPVGSWVNTQRTTKDKISPVRKARLEALPGWIWRVK
jgi:hypothetical protein